MSEPPYVIDEDNPRRVLQAGYEAGRFATEKLARAFVEAMDTAHRDYFAMLVERARAAAAKAMVRYPQPNYVSLKIAEEAGEVVRGAVHYCEKRMEWAEVEGEIVQLLAMLIRFVTEGDQVIGAIPPTANPRDREHG